MQIDFVHGLRFAAHGPSPSALSRQPTIVQGIGNALRINSDRRPSGFETALEARFAASDQAPASRPVRRSSDEQAHSTPADASKQKLAERTGRGESDRSTGEAHDRNKNAQILREQSDAKPVSQSIDEHDDAPGEIVENNEPIVGSAVDGSTQGQDEQARQARASADDFRGKPLITRVSHPEGNAGGHVTAAEDATEASKTIVLRVATRREADVYAAAATGKEGRELSQAADSQHPVPTDTDAANRAARSHRHTRDGDVRVTPEGRESAQQAHTQAATRQIGQDRAPVDTSSWPRSFQRDAPPERVDSTRQRPFGESAASSSDRISAAAGRAAQVEAAIRLEQQTGQAAQSDASARLTTQQPNTAATLNLGGSISQGQTNGSSLGQTFATDSSGMDANSRRTPIDDARFSGRIIRGLTAMLNSRGGTMTMRLDPPELGQLRIQMTLARGVVNAQLYAQSSAAQQLLEKNIASLRSALESQGLTVERLHVQSSSSSNQNMTHDDATGRDQHHNAADGQSRGRRDRQRAVDAQNGEHVGSMLFDDHVEQHLAGRD